MILCLVALALAAPTHAGSKRMVGFEIRGAFEGITLDGIYNDGQFFSETYFEDGSIRYHDVEGADSGQWTVEDDKFCTFYENLLGACFFVYRDGPNCYSFYEEDDDGQPSAEWTSRGWDREEDSTCPTAPAAEV